MSLYLSPLPQLESDVCLLQRKEPLIHKVHGEIYHLFRGFLVCFMKAEMMEKSPTHTKWKPFRSMTKILLSNHLICISVSGANDIIQERQKDDKAVECFWKIAAAVYPDCSLYLQNKLPLDNKLLESVSAIDPASQGHGVHQQGTQGSERIGSRCTLTQKTWVHLTWIWTSGGNRCVCVWMSGGQKSRKLEGTMLIARSAVQYPAPSTLRHHSTRCEMSQTLNDAK